MAETDLIMTKTNDFLNKIKQIKKSAVPVIESILNAKLTEAGKIEWINKLTLDQKAVLLYYEAVHSAVLDEYFEVDEPYLTGEEYQNIHNLLYKLNLLDED